MNALLLTLGLLPSAPLPTPSPDWLPKSLPGVDITYEHFGPVIVLVGHTPLGRNFLRDECPPGYAGTFVKGKDGYSADPGRAWQLKARAEGAGLKVEDSDPYDNPKYR